MRKLALLCLLVLFQATPALASWAGYAKVASSTSASGNFVVPEIACGPGHQGDGFAVFIGVDGWANGYVEQAGVSTWCDRGVAIYNAWYENYPFPAHDLNVNVGAGDEIRVEVTLAPGAVTELLRNVTTGVQDSNTANLTRPGGSREWIAEKLTNTEVACSTDIVFTKSGGFPSGLTKAVVSPFDVGPVSGTSFTISDDRACF